MTDACEKLETVPTTVWRGIVRRCFQGTCEWAPGPESARPPPWLVKLRDDFARRAGFEFMKPQLRAIQPNCANTFGGRWFPEYNGIGILLHSSAPTTFGVAVHEMTHWLQWVIYGDEPGEHDKRFFALLERTYPAYGVSLQTAKEIEGDYYPSHWAAMTWADVRKRSPYGNVRTSRSSGANSNRGRRATDVARPKVHVHVVRSR